MNHRLFNIILSATYIVALFIVVLDTLYWSLP